VRGERRRRLHKAFLRWHDPANWPLLREALRALGREDLIGSGKRHLVPTFQPQFPAAARGARPVKAAPPAGRLLTQHTGLPPQPTAAVARGDRGRAKRRG
jgi:hypothetical protein